MIPNELPTTLTYRVYPLEDSSTYAVYLTGRVMDGEKELLAPRCIRRLGPGVKWAGVLAYLAMDYSCREETALLKVHYREVEGGMGRGWRTVEVQDRPGDGFVKVFHGGREGQ